SLPLLSPMPSPDRRHVPVGASVALSPPPQAANLSLARPGGSRPGPGDQALEPSFTPRRGSMRATEMVKLAGRECSAAGAGYVFGKTRRNGARARGQVDPEARSRLGRPGPGAE